MNEHSLLTCHYNLGSFITIYPLCLMSVFILRILLPMLQICVLVFAKGEIMQIYIF